MFPKIGAIVRRQDGTYEVGPLPGLGGPFSTATEYLVAWAQAARFPNMEGASDEIKASITEFPHLIEALAANIPIQDHGPFPLVHDDFGHNNIVVDDDYNILGVIDWENACSMPWESVYFPLTLSVVPHPMVPAWMYEDGVPKHKKIRIIIDERKDYVNTIRQIERREGLSHSLSATLGDQAGEQLAYAMKLYIHDRKFGFYTKILDVYHQKWSGGKKNVDVSEGAGNSKSLPAR